MEGRNYYSEDMEENDLLSKILKKLEGIYRLEKKLYWVTNQFTGELDVIKSELARIVEARKGGKAEMVTLQASIRNVNTKVEYNDGGLECRCCCEKVEPLAKIEWQSWKYVYRMVRC